MADCWIGIDIGLTTAKASAFDESGLEIATVQSPNRRMATRENWQEIDMLSLWKVVSELLADLSGRLAKQGFTAAGAAVTGAGNGIFLVDEALTPVRAGIASTDTRAEAIVSSLDAAAVEQLRLKTGTRPWSAQTPALISWLNVFEPEVLERSRWVLTLKDWITTCLTGLPSADLSDASACGLVNLSERSWEPTVFPAFGLPSQLRDKLPPLYGSKEFVGGVSAQAHKSTGLPQGMPIVAGCIDVMAAPYGAGSVNEHDVTIISGTWGINSVAHRLGHNIPDVTINVAHPDEGLVFSQEDAPTSMANLEWLASSLQQFGSEKVTARELVEIFAVAPQLTDSLTYVPFIYGEPRTIGASASLIGLRGHHTHSDIARAMVEGITFYHRRQLERVRNQGVVLSEGPWVIAGGGARNAAWAQLFANVLNHPVKRHTEGELGTRGAAFLASEGTGASTNEWASDSSGSGTLIEPNADVQLYQQRAEQFDSVVADLENLWRKNISTANK